MKPFAIGLDFGTSKTAMTMNGTGGVNPNVQDVAIGDSTSSPGRTPTCVFSDPATGDLAIGIRAEEECNRRRLDGKDPPEFHSNFKPHIHQDQSARDLAYTFLTELTKVPAVSQLLDFQGADSMLVAGYPVAWSEQGRSTLVGLLHAAGFKNVHCVGEPVGAAFYFLANGLAAKEFLRDVVIFDWGAGTFDLTVVRSGSIETDSSWGSTLYGGRLFDDLIFQWLSEMIATDGSHVADLERILSVGSYRAFLQTIVCRRIKEDLSRSLTQGNSGDYEYKERIELGSRRNRIDLGYFAVDDGAELLTRAANYKASKYIQTLIAKAANEAKIEEKSFADKLVSGQSVDLIAWASTLIGAGMRHLNVSGEPLAILTGGSCNFKWFQDEIRKHSLFAHQKGRSIFIDGQPEMTIARGLGRAYAIGGYALDLERKLKENEWRIVTELAGKVRENRTKVLVARIAGRLERDMALSRTIYGSFRRAVESPEFDAAVVAAEISALLKSWFADPDVRGEVSAAAAAFAQGTFHDAMETLQHVLDKDVGGLLVVAMEVCGVTGEGDIAKEVQAMVERVDFGETIFDWFRKAMQDLWRRIARQSESVEERAKRLANEAQRHSKRFYANYIQSIEVMLIKESAKTAQRIIEHVEQALESIRRISGIERVVDAGPTSFAVPMR